MDSYENKNVSNIMQIEQVAFIDLVMYACLYITRIDEEEKPWI